TIGIKLKDALKDSKELSELIGSSPAYKQLFEYAKILEGMERHSSVHAAGIVIAPRPLTEFLPLYKEPRTGKTTTQYTMNYIEDIGLLKMDILGLRNLTVISDAVKMIKDKGVELDIETIPLDNKKTYALFARGDTIGVFQFESSGMRDYLRKLKPESIEDLTAMNALYRPGPLGNNMVDDFILRKHGEVKVEYIHPLLEPVLKETYGVIVYQEQVMRIAGDLAGFSLGEADLLRRAMGKKKFEIMEQNAKEFTDGAAKKGIDGKIAKEIFDNITKFALYGFNKSHSAAYSLIAYQTAYLKTHHPSEFMAANLSSEKDNTDRIVVLLEECRHMGIDILPPDVMKSGVNFTVEDGAIRFGLAAIKNVGSGAMGSLVDQREVFRKSKHFFEFCEQCEIKSINKKILESLIKAGALDSLPWTRTEKFESIETALNYAHQSAQDRERGQTNIFDSGNPDEETSKEYPEPPPVEEWSKYENLAREKEVLGFYISGHPLDKYRDELTGLSTTTIEELGNLENNTVIRNGGIIIILKVTPTKKNKKNMAFFTLEDFSGSIEAVLFPDLYEEYKNIVKEDKMVFIKGKISKREEDNPKIIVDEMYPISKARQMFAKKVLVHLKSSGLDRNTLESLGTLFEKHKGECTLFFNVKTLLDEELIMKSKKYKLDPGEKSIAALRKVLGKDNVKIAGDNGLFVQAPGRR
ncbi:MAG: DNA polymerase III subunit alpha, partial [bacterium]|nr:DNA polymerase III subunit alpha [bacterium]